VHGQVLDVMRRTIHPAQRIEEHNAASLSSGKLATNWLTASQTTVQRVCDRRVVGRDVWAGGPRPGFRTMELTAAAASGLREAEMSSIQPPTPSTVLSASIRAVKAESSLWLEESVGHRSPENCTATTGGSLTMRYVARLSP